MDIFRTEHLRHPRDTGMQLIYDPREGVNISESRVARLIDYAFLKPFCFHNLYYRRSGNKEFIDTAVFFGNHVILISTKTRTMSPRQTYDVNWNRWFKKVLVGGTGASVSQFGRAVTVLREGWQLFLDRGCTEPLNLPLPSYEDMVIHRVVVNTNIGRFCNRHHGSPHLRIDMALKGEDHKLPARDLYGPDGKVITGGYKRPFTIGQPAPQHGYIHTFDIDAFQGLLFYLDTPSDFLAYLGWREDIYAQGVRLKAESDLDIAGFYLMNKTGNGECDTSRLSADDYRVPEDTFRSYERNLRLERNSKSEDEIPWGYNPEVDLHWWDGTIEITYNTHQRRRETAEEIDPEREIHSRRLLQLMASEDRSGRYKLSDAYAKLGRTPSEGLDWTFEPSPATPGLYYLFVSLLREDTETVEAYAETWRTISKAVALELKLLDPDATSCIIIGLEPGPVTALARLVSFVDCVDEIIVDDERLDGLREFHYLNKGEALEVKRLPDTEIITMYIGEAQANPEDSTQEHSMAGLLIDPAARDIILEEVQKVREDMQAQMPGMTNLPIIDPVGLLAGEGEQAVLYRNIPLETRHAWVSRLINVLAEGGARLIIGSSETGSQIGEMIIQNLNDLIDHHLSDEKETILGSIDREALAQIEVRPIPLTLSIVLSEATFFISLLSLNAKSVCEDNELTRGISLSGLFGDRDIRKDKPSIMLPERRDVQREPFLQLANLLAYLNSQTQKWFAYGQILDPSILTWMESEEVRKMVILFEKLERGTDREVSIYMDLETNERHYMSPVFAKSVMWPQTIGLLFPDIYLRHLLISKSHEFDLEAQAQFENLLSQKSE